MALGIVNLQQMPALGHAEPLWWKTSLNGHLSVREETASMNEESTQEVQ